MHQVILIYMRMVVVIIQLIRAVRNGVWEGHLNAVIEFVNCFFVVVFFFLHLTN